MAGPVDNSAMKHIYPVSARADDGRLVGLTNGTVCFASAWGVDMNEAVRRTFRTIERVKTENILYRGRTAVSGLGSV